MRAPFVPMRQTPPMARHRGAQARFIVPASGFRKSWNKPGINRRTRFAYPLYPGETRAQAALFQHRFG